MVGPVQGRYQTLLTVRGGDHGLGVAAHHGSGAGVAAAAGAGERQGGHSGEGVAHVGGLGDGKGREKIGEAEPVHTAATRRMGTRKLTGTA